MNKTFVGALLWLETASISSLICFLIPNCIRLNSIYHRCIVLDKDEEVCATKSTLGEPNGTKDTPGESNGGMNIIVKSRNIAESGN